jgi:hypothetical protein
MEPRFPIGTKFVPQGRKRQDVCTVVDILKTSNNAGELVKILYCASHSFQGQAVLNCDVVEPTIARGLIKEGL